MRLTAFLALTAILWIRTESLPAGEFAPVPEVDRIFGDYDNNKSPGCALGVIRDGEFIYRRGYGMANLEHGVPISSSSVFRIGSTSKQFTALSIALLANRGKLSLDDPVAKYFPVFPDWAGGMTVRQLILHTSGIRDYLELALLTGRGGEFDYYTDDWAIALLARQKDTNFPPGEEYLYSNSGYLLLAHIVNRVTGSSLKEFAEEYIFGPLGMKHTHFHDDHTHVVPGRAAGYAPASDGYRISMTTLDIVGDGSVYTTIDDLLLWDRNFYDNRIGDGGPELIGQITRPGTLNNGEFLDYAFGLTVDNYRGLPMLSHSGSFVGYRAEMIRFPEQRFSVAVLCNRSDGAPTEKARRAADHYLSEVLAPKPGEAVTVAITMDETELSRHAGDFWEARQGFVAETRVAEGKLWAVHSPESRNELEPLGSNRFRMLGVGAEVIVSFEMGDEGVLRMTSTVDGKPGGVFTPFSRRQFTAAELAEYAGEYFSEELGSLYRLTVAEGRLEFRVLEHPPEKLTPVFGEIFENPDYGSFEFTRNGEGAVTGFLLQSGRVRNLHFRRQGS